MGPGEFPGFRLPNCLFCPASGGRPSIPFLNHAVRGFSGKLTGSVEAAMICRRTAWSSSRSDCAPGISEAWATSRCIVSLLPRRKKYQYFTSRHSPSGDAAVCFRKNCSCFITPVQGHQSRGQISRCRCRNGVNVHRRANAATAFSYSPNTAIIKSQIVQKPRARR